MTQERIDRVVSDTCLSQCTTDGMTQAVEIGPRAESDAAAVAHHDKVIVVDGDTVELGSFNYSDAAADKNSENVLVNWHNPQLAKIYLDHFARNYRQAHPYETRY